MIGSDMADAQTILSDLETISTTSTFGPDVEDVCRQLRTTIVDAAFPGALVPVTNAAGRLQILVAAPTMMAWRRLAPVLKAFAGPTITSFNGITAPLPPGEPTAQRLAQTRPAATCVIQIPQDRKSVLLALRALMRVRETIARAPDLQSAVSEPTSWLLARFQDNLNVGRRDAATAILDRLKGDLRLDALNTKFLEVQLLATFGDWAAIVALAGFGSLRLARRPPAITALLLEALYRTHLADLFDAIDRSRVYEIYQTTVHDLAQPLLSVPLPSTLTPGGLKLYALELLTSSSRSDIKEALSGNHSSLEWLADELDTRPSAVSPQSTSTPPSSPLDDARAALVQVDAVEAVDNVAAAFAALAKLAPAELALLRDAEPFSTAVRLIEANAPGGVPSSWIEWLEKTADPSFTNALEIARHGKDEWSAQSSTSDPSHVAAFVTALNLAQDDPLASERTAQALPFLVAWLQRDPAFPAPTMAPVYSSLLTLFALNSTRGGSVYESSQVLVEALLTVGVNEANYASLIADINELAGQAFGIDMIYWVLDTIESFMRASAPDAKSREAFLHSILARTAPLYGRLSTLQRTAVKRLAGELGWSLDALGVSVEPESNDDVSHKLEGLRIAIYSLTETSSRQAKNAIEEMAPTAVVDCAADHGGSVRLKALAENADIFVVTWLSAKHAATEFIREHREDRTLLYAQGRGFSSILRALDDHFK
ncbi:protein DpdD [Neorhizobium sp. T7_12]|uniref:protein DpdD n=1 Tax=Neorhizobium sp. T7_12 TaxID=2093832 RepID=UPI000CFA0E9C|nr:protein DpdD [Neorhizobium sp. T7_12]